MLRAVTLENIRGFVGPTRIELSPLTVFVGANASGKTTVLECVDLALRVGRTAHASLFSSRTAPARLITPGCPEAAIGVEYDGDAGPARLELTIRREAPPSGFGQADQRPRSTLLQLDPRVLARASVLTRADPEPELDPDGGGLAAILGLLIGRRDGAIESIEEALRGVVPQVRRLRVVPEEVEVGPGTSGSRAAASRGVIGSRLEVEFGKMGFIPAVALSEGTLIVLGILTAIHHKGGENVVLLDDIDRGLHPTAQSGMIAAIRRLVEHRGDLQLVCTSHSTYALDAFDAREVRVTWVDREGVASHRTLSDHPEWGEWAKVMDAGEFWSTVGEAWVSGISGDAVAGAAGESGGS